MHTLKTHTIPSQQTDTYLVYWTNSTVRLGGLLRVKVAAKVEDKAIAAELAAIQHLLEVRCVLGNNISGNAKTQLVVSSGAIRKLQRRQSDKVHLAPYANFLCTRFAACPITVEKDTRWFSEQLPVTEEDLLVSGPRKETIRLRGLGEVSVTRHVLDRFVDRALVDQSSDQVMQVAWKKLSRLAEHQSVKEVSRQSLWAGVIHNRNGKHEGRYFLNSVQQMVMVVTDNPNEGPRLVTTYPVTRHFRQMAEAA
jgi:hypothetical protein